MLGQRHMLNAVAAMICFCLTASPAAAELNWAEKMFSELEHDFGVVARGADVRHRIVITNLYEETITITKVDTTCGCTAAEPSKRSLTTGEKAYIEVVMDTKKFMRKKDSNVDVTLTFDNINFKTVRIPIHAYIRSDVVIQPGAAKFDAVDLGRGAQMGISIAYAGRDDWRIKHVKSNNRFVKAAVRELQRGNGRVNYELTVQIDPSAPEGTLRDHLTMVTNDTANPYIPFLVEAKIEPDIVIANPHVALGALSPGVEKTVRVVLRGRKPFAIERIECESDLECFRVKLSHTPKTVHVLPLTVTPPNKPGEFSETFIVTIAGRSEPLTFHASGKIE